VTESLETHKAEAQAAAIRHRRAANQSSSQQTQRGETPGYAGLVTRTVAFAVDGAIINGTAALVAFVVALGLSVLHISGQAKTIIELVGGGAWVLWSVCYFAFFWSSTGETPGDHVMRIRVIDDRNRGTLRPLRAVARFGFLILAVLPLGAGILMMLWDDRLRCLQDRMTRTVVVPSQPPKPLNAELLEQAVVASSGG